LNADPLLTDVLTDIVSVVVCPSVAIALTTSVPANFPVEMLSRLVVAAWIAPFLHHVYVTGE
jgi:hypothetical protein